MYLDVLELSEFYATQLGLLARRMIAREIRALWPDTHGLEVLGLGYAVPYLAPFRREAARTIALMPAAQGIARWPLDAPGLASLADESVLPLLDSSFDRILVVHALENTESARAFLREVWRVLAPEGRLLVVVPHRRTLWAGRERTPFGHGHPYSRAQIARLLNDNLFAATRPRTALFFPPYARASVLRSAVVWENAGRRLWPGVGGVILMEAVKRLYAAPPLKAARRVPRPAPIGVPAIR